MIFVNLAGIPGRFTITALVEPMGWRVFGTLFCVMAALLIVRAGYLYNVYIEGWSLFYMLLVVQGFFSSAIYSCRALHDRNLARPACSTGMVLGYGVGNLGVKLFGPLGLALIMGAGDIIAGGVNRGCPPGFHLFCKLVRPRHHRLPCSASRPRAARSRRSPSRAAVQPVPARVSRS